MYYSLSMSIIYYVNILLLYFVIIYICVLDDFNDILQNNKILKILLCDSAYK